jgi:asparagine synthase (glutamine-hydrolysing)
MTNLSSALSFYCLIDLGSSSPINCDNEQYQFTDGGSTILGKVRLDNYRELCDELGGGFRSHLEVALAAWNQWGKSFLKHIYGDFSLLIFTHQDNRLFAARDHLGVRPFFYRQVGQTLHMSTSLRALADSDEGELDEEYQIRYLNGFRAHATATIYKNIFRLAPAHSLEFSQRQLKITRYWQLRCPAEQKISQEQAIAEFNEHLFRAVRCRLPPAGAHLGCELSGGMDSGTITAIGAKLFNKGDIFTFSHVMRDEDLSEAEYKDERQRINSLCQFHGGLNNIPIDDRGRGMLEDLKLQTSILASMPTVNTTASSHRLYEEAAAAKCNVVFSGFGGDECISMRSPGTFINDMIVKKRWVYVIRELHAHRPLLWPLALVNRLYKFHYGAKAVSRSPRVDYSYLLKEEYKRKPPVRQASIESGFKRTKSLLPDRLRTAERLEETVLAAEHYGIEYRFPLMDVQLIQYYLSLPPQFKLHKGMNRYLLRQSTRNLLPDDIRLGIKEPGTTVPSSTRRRKITLQEREVDIGRLPWICEKSRKKVLDNLYSENSERLKVSLQQAHYLTIFHEFHNNLRKSLTSKRPIET